MMDSKEELAALMLHTFQRGLNEGVEHRHPKTGELLTDVESIIRVLQNEGSVHLKFTGDEGGVVSSNLTLDDKGSTNVGLVAVVGILATVMVILVLMFGIPIWNVWRSTLSGEALLKQAQQTRQIQVAQAQGELDAAKLRAQAISIVGKAAKEYPEYRQQEFIGAFAEALKEGKMDQIIYVPTEANIPIIEAGSERIKK